jgi:3-dehydroquinate synthase
MISKIIQFNHSKTEIRLGDDLNEIRKYRSVDKVIFITDKNVYSCYNELLKTEKVIILESGESTKSLSTIENIINKFLEFNVDREYLVIGFGGGVVCDITGFVASIYNRGVKFGFVPTSLLAMLDASIGGKNAINFNSFKNIIGTFNQPEFISIIPELLLTLPHNELVNGFAEAIKMAVLSGENDFEYFEEKIIKNINEYDIEEIIKNAAEFKLSVVQEDEYEKGYRRILNFGHTFGHAIESVYQIPHGNAVSLGIIKALELSEKICGFENSKTSRIKQALQNYDLPIEYDYDLELIKESIINDKKKKGNSINFVLLKDIGEPIIKEISFKDLLGI